MTNHRPMARSWRTAVAMPMLIVAGVACGPPVSSAPPSDETTGAVEAPTTSGVLHDVGVAGRDLPATGGDPTPDPDGVPEHIVQFDAVACGRGGRPCLFEQARITIGFHGRLVADLDQDGDLDAMAADPLGQWIARASAPWTFGVTDLGAHWPTGAVFDGDGDGDRDLVFVSLDELMIVRARGSGYAEPERWPAGRRNYGAVRADLDGDGRDELLFVDAENDAVAVLRAFTSAGPELAWIAVGANPLDVAPVDLDADDAIDLVVASANADAIEILRGDGRSGFEPWATIPAGASPRSIAVADLDADAQLDLVSANYEDETLTIALGDAGTWTPTTIAAPCPAPRQVVALALQDGLVDLVVRCDEGGSLHLLAGVGDGTFVAGGSYAADVEDMSIVDLDDGDAPVLLVSHDDPPVVVLRDHDLRPVVGYPGRGRGEVIDGALYVTGADSRRIALGNDGARLVPAMQPVDPSFAADLDGDGVVDIVGRHEGVVAVLPGTGDGGFGPPVTSGVLAQDVVPAQLDDDPFPDAISRLDPVCTAMYGDGGLGFVARALEVDCGSARLGDADGDGRTDVFDVVDDVAQISTIEDGELVPWISGPAPAMSPMFVGDLDRDGVPDVAARRGCCRLFVWSSLSDAGLGEPSWQLVLPEQELDALALEDVDGDGVRELVTRTYELWVIRPEGAEWIARRLSESSCEWTVREDVDGDGVQDLLRPFHDGLAGCTSVPR
jgi:hypothetical protein